MTTSDFYAIQELPESKYADLFVQTQEPGTIWSFTSSQSSYVFGDLAEYQISFEPINPIPAKGMILIQWTDQLSLTDKSECSIETFKVFDGRKVCEFDLDKKQVLVRGIFESRETYSGEITIILTNVTNPLTNQNLDSIVISTFEDVEMKYAID